MSYVYFIAPEAVFVRREHALRVVKIGYTKSHPTSRMSNLQTGCPVPLDLIAFVDGDLALEQAFHECFAELRWQGEWFLLERKLHDFLGYFDEMPINQRYVPRDRLEVSISDNIFARASSHPSMTDDEYLASANIEPIRRHFPELWREHSAAHLELVQ